MTSDPHPLAPIARLAALPGRAVVTGLSLVGGLTYYGLVAAWLAGVMNPATALGWPAVFTAVLMLAGASLVLDRGDQPWFRLDVAPELYRGEVAQNMVFLVIALLPLALLMIGPTRTMSGPIIRGCRPLIRSLLEAVAAVIQPVGRLGVLVARWAVGTSVTVSRFWWRVGLTIGRALRSALSLVVTWLGKGTLALFDGLYAVSRFVLVSFRAALERALKVTLALLRVIAAVLMSSLQLARAGLRVLRAALAGPAAAAARLVRSMAKALAWSAALTVKVLTLAVRASVWPIKMVLRPLGFVARAILGLIAAMVGTVASDVSSLGQTVSRWLRRGVSVLANSRRTVPVPLRVVALGTLAIGVLYVNWSTVVGLLRLRRADALVAFLAALSSGS